MRAAAAPPNGIDGRAAAAAAAAAGEAFDAAAAQATAAVARQAAESRAAAEAAGATAEHAEAAFGEAARARALAAAEARGAAVEAASAAAAEEVRLLVAEKRAAERDRDFYAARLEGQPGGGGDGGGREAATLQVGRGAARSTSSRGSTRRALQHDARSLHPPLLRRHLEWPQSDCSRAAAAWQVQLQDVQRRLDEAGQATDAARKQCADAVRERHSLKARAAATTPSLPTPAPP